MSDRSRAWKVAAVVALMVATAAVGAKIYKWRFTGKHPEYGYMLRSEDGNTVTNIPESWADSPEQAVEVKEELDIQEQQDNRKLVGVSERTANGQLHRSFSYEHTLSDGRVIKKRESDPDFPPILTVEQLEEMEQLWYEEIRQHGKETATIEEKTVLGHVFTFKKWRLVLSDGTEIVYSIGRLKEDQ